MNETNAKPVWQSRAAVAAFVGAALNLATALGFDFGITEDQVVDHYMNVVNAGLFAYALYGRVIATKRIGSR